MIKYGEGKMKKLLIILLSISVLSQFVLLSGCVQEDVCQHKFEEIVSEEYLLKSADCDHSASYVESCSKCGEKGTKIFNYGEEYHKYLDKDKCVLCQKEKPLYVMYIEDEDEYKVTMKYGDYPQSKVENEELILSLNNLHGELPTQSDQKDWTSYQVYVERQLRTDIMWYKDVVYDNERYRAVYFVEYRPERTFNPTGESYSMQAGHGYQTHTVYWFKWEPIIWRVLFEDGFDAMLMNDYSLYTMEYFHHGEKREIDGQTVYPNNYMHSNVRKWLNDDFYNDAFNEREKSAINLTEVDNSAPTTNIYNDPYYFEGGVNIYVCENVEDKVFMPSLVDMTNPEYGFTRDISGSPARRFIPTEYAKSLGAISGKSYNGSGYAWTRSPQCYYDFGLRRTAPEGAMIRSTNVDFSSVAPIICINLDMKK